MEKREGTGPRHWGGSLRTCQDKCATAPPTAATAESSLPAATPPRKTTPESRRTGDHDRVLRSLGGHSHHTAPTKSSKMTPNNTSRARPAQHTLRSLPFSPPLSPPLPSLDWPLSSLLPDVVVGALVTSDRGAGTCGTGGSAVSVRVDHAYGRVGSVAGRGSAVSGIHAVRRHRGLRQGAGNGAGTRA